MQFVYTLKDDKSYTVLVQKEGFADNCRTFKIIETKNFLDVGLSPELNDH